MPNLQTIALIGRPNVGKSTLFNRLIRQTKAIAHNRPGVTRDVLRGEVRRDGETLFSLVDTGGVGFDEAGSPVPGPDGLKGYETEVTAVAVNAMREADVLCLVVDGREGATAMDERIARFARRTGKPVLLVVNKVDGEAQEDRLLADYYDLGLPVVPVSAAHGYNVGGLLDAMLDALPEREIPVPAEEAEGTSAADGEEGEGAEEVLDPEKGLKIALLGRPNAGKSSLVNAFAGETRLIVSEIPGTTRDAVDVTVDLPLPKGKTQRATFIDTAGMRKRTNVVDQVEKLSVARSIGSARRADVTLLVVDATEGLLAQDKKLLSWLDREKLPFLVLVNKIDVLKKADLEAVKTAVGEELRICPHVETLFVSAMTKRNLEAVLGKALALWREAGRRIGTGALNRALPEALVKQPPLVKGRRAKFYYMTQTGVRPATFVFFVNDPERVKPSYARYLENRLRATLKLPHAPLKMVFRPAHGDKKAD